MAVILWAMGLSLLMQGCLCSVGQTNRGCLKWSPHGNDVCCDICHPGNRLVKNCGPRPQDLCTPCEPKTFTVKPKHLMCTPCTQCIGAQVLVKECTTTHDTKCGCKEGLTCGNEHCTFCVKKCGKGQEPTENRSCRTCPNGTFNDQIHQKCKPWSTKCPSPDQKIVAEGDAFTDIKCDVFPGSQTTVEQSGAQVLATNHTKRGCKEGLTCGNEHCTFCVKKCDTGQEPTETRSCRTCPNGTFNDQIHQKCKPWSTKCPSPDQKIVAEGDAFSDIKCVSLRSQTTVEQSEQTWPLVLSVLTGIALIVFGIIIIVTMKLHQKKRTKKTITKPPIIRTPTDDPRTLIAIECSFHEAEQEQGSSSESLASNDTSKQLIG